MRAGAVALLAAVPAAVLASPLRLIATEPDGPPRWLDPAAIDALAASAHAAGHCGGFMDVTGQPAAAPVRAAALWRAPPHASQQATVRRLAPGLDPARVRAAIATLVGFGTRYYDSPQGAAAARWIADHAAARAALAGRDDVTVALFRHDFAQPSVIVTIAGRGPDAAQTIVLGAHADSINWQLRRPAAAAPGADDDASGVAILLAVLDAMLDGDYRPQRTVQLIAYAGEELGLLGSQAIAQAYRAAAVPVVAAWQLDMAMAPAPHRRVAFVTDQASLPLTAFAEHLVDTYLALGHERTRCGYACSDHASWHRAGVPTAFPFEAPFAAANPAIHTAGDVEAPLDLAFGMQLARLTLAFAVELADGAW